MIEHPPVTSCGFVYLVLMNVTGLIGLILFSLAAKRYKYGTGMGECFVNTMWKRSMIVTCIKQQLMTILTKSLMLD